MNVNFTFSDTVAGYVSSFDSKENKFVLKTSDDREITVHLTPNTFSKFTFNLGEGYRDATGQAPSLLALNRQFVFAYGTFYPGTGGPGKFEAQWLVFPGQGPGVYRHEEPDWWINQARSIGKSYSELAVRLSGHRDRLQKLPHDAASGRRQEGRLSPGDGHDQPPGLRSERRLYDDRRRAVS